MANGITPRPNYQGGEVSVAPYLQGITNVILANQQRAQQQAEKEAERADKIYDSITSEVAKVNPNGLRNADYEGFQAMYQEQIKAPMIDALLARQNGDMATYAKKMAEVNAGIGTVNSFISRSKQEAKFEYDLAEDIRKNPDRYSDQSTGLYKTRVSTPLNNLSGNLMQGSDAWIRQVDTSKVQGQVDDLLSDIFKTSGQLSGIKQQRTTVGGRGADIVQFEEAVDKDAFAEAARMRFASDPAWRAYAEQNGLGSTPEEAAINLTALYESNGRFTRTDGRQIVRDQAPSQSGGGTDSARVGDLAYNVPINIGGQRVFATRGVDLTTSNVVIPNREAVDAETGQVVNLGDIKADTGVKNGQITGVLEIPALNNVFGTGNNEVVEYQIQVPNPNFDPFMARAGLDSTPEVTTKTYYIRRDLLPSGTQTNKDVKRAVEKFDNARGSSSQGNSVSLTDNTVQKPKFN